MLGSFVAPYVKPYWEKGIQHFQKSNGGAHNKRQVVERNVLDNALIFESNRQKVPDQDCSDTRLSSVFDEVTNRPSKLLLVQSVRLAKRDMSDDKDKLSYKDFYETFKHEVEHPESAVIQPKHNKTTSDGIHKRDTAGRVEYSVSSDGLHFNAIQPDHEKNLGDKQRQASKETTIKIIESLPRSNLVKLDGSVASDLDGGEHGLGLHKRRNDDEVQYNLDSSGNVHFKAIHPWHHNLDQQEVKHVSSDGPTTLQRRDNGKSSFSYDTDKSGSVHFKADLPGKALDALKGKDDKVHLNANFHPKEGLAISFAPTKGNDQSDPDHQHVKRRSIFRPDR